MPQAETKNSTGLTARAAYEAEAVNSIVSLFRTPANDTAPKKTVAQVIAEAVEKLPPHSEVPKAQRSPYVTHYGKVLDPVAHARWATAQREKGGAK